MKSGWYKENYRHSLAARGIQTNQYMAKKAKSGVSFKFVDPKPQLIKLRIEEPKPTYIKFAVPSTAKEFKAIGEKGIETAEEKYARANLALANVEAAAAQEWKGVKAEAEERFGPTIEKVATPVKKELSGVAAEAKERFGPTVEKGAALAKEYGIEGPVDLAKRNLEEAKIKAGEGKAYLPWSTRKRLEDYEQELEAVRQKQLEFAWELRQKAADLDSEYIDQAKKALVTRELAEKGAKLHREEDEIMKELGQISKTPDTRYYEPSDKPYIKSTKGDIERELEKIQKEREELYG